MTAHAQILDAAFDLTVSRGWAKVTMAELAAAAGVSRQSVYNEFGTREGVAQALVDREVARFLAVVDAELAAAPSPRGAVIAAAHAVFTTADENPLLRSLLTGDDPSLLPLLGSGGVIAVAQAHVRAGLPDLDDVALDTVVRLVISHVVAPGSQRPDLAEVARRLVPPG